VGTAYVVASWLLIQVAETVFPLFGFDENPARIVVTMLAIGVIPVLIFAWAFELTPGGLKKEKDVNRDLSITQHTGKKLDRWIFAVLAVALGYFAFDKFVLTPQREAAQQEYRAEELEQARQEGRKETLSATHAGKSIAVLPFVNRSQQQEDTYFTDGMHDELLTRLAQISALKVVSRTSVLRYRETTKSIPEIGKELMVDTILEGGVQRLGNQVRVNVQLINAQTDEHIWAEIFDRELTVEHLFAIQSDISRAITHSLKATLTADEDVALAYIPTNNLAAYDAYISARSNLNSTAVSDLETAVAQFTLATQLDADFAAAWAGLCEANLSFYSKNSDQSYFSAAEAACNTALELDGSRLDVYVALGSLYRHSGLYSRAEVSLQQANFAKAEQALGNALEIDTRSVDALIELGFLLAEQGRLAEAEAELLRTIELDPNDWRGQTALFNFYYGSSDKPERFKLASRHAVLAASLRPELASSWNNVGSAKFMLLQYEQAAEAWQQSLTIEPTRTAYTNTGLALYSAGRFQEAAKMQEKATVLAPKDHRAWGRLADALLRIEGEHERAVEVYAWAADLAEEKLEVNAKDWRTLGYLAIYLVHTGESENAITTCEGAMRLSGRRPEALFRAALVYYAAGNNELTLSLLEELVAKDASYRQFLANEFISLAELDQFKSIIATP